MKNPVKLFGKRVKLVRQRQHMSQGDLSKIMGVHRAYISGVERGVRNPSLLTIKKFAKALGTSASKLVENI